MFRKRRKYFERESLGLIRVQFIIEILQLFRNLAFLLEFDSILFIKRSKSLSRQWIYRRPKDSIWVIAFEKLSNHIYTLYQSLRNCWVPIIIVLFIWRHRRFRLLNFLFESFLFTGYSYRSLFKVSDRVFRLKLIEIMYACFLCRVI